MRTLAVALGMIVTIGLVHQGNAALSVLSSPRDRAMAACLKEFPDKYQKPTTPRVRCILHALARDDLATANAAATASVALQLRSLLEMAEHYDAGLLSVEEYAAGRMRVVAQVREALQARD